MVAAAAAVVPESPPKATGDDEEEAGGNDNFDKPATGRGTKTAPLGGAVVIRSKLVAFEVAVVLEVDNRGEGALARFFIFFAPMAAWPG